MSFNVPSGYVVFSKSVCPNCVTLKQRLITKNIPFIEIKVDEDTEAREFLVGQGFRSVPVLFVDGENIPVNVV